MMLRASAISSSRIREIMTEIAIEKVSHEQYGNGNRQDERPFAFQRRATAERW